MIYNLCYYSINTCLVSGLFIFTDFEAAGKRENSKNKLYIKSFDLIDALKSMVPSFLMVINLLKRGNKSPLNLWLILFLNNNKQSVKKLKSIYLQINRLNFNY